MITTASQYVVDAANQVAEITDCIRATVRRGIDRFARTETAFDEQDQLDIKAALAMLLAQLDAAVRFFEYVLEVEQQKKIAKIR